MSLIAITAVGRDRPGIVAGFSGALYRLGCNLEDTTMTRLGDQFAMILLARLPEPESASALEASLQQTASELGLSLAIRWLSEEEARRRPAGEAYMLRLHGADRPGIVHAATDLLARHGLNITDLTTRVLHGDQATGYMLLLEVESPSPEAAAAVERELERLRREINVEVSFEPLEQEAL